MRRSVIPAVVGAVVLFAAGIVPDQAARRPAGPSVSPEAAAPVRTVDLGALAASPRPATGSAVQHLTIVRPTAAAGPRAATAPSAAASVAAPHPRSDSPVVLGGDAGRFNGIDSIDMETGGTGPYAGTNPTLEPPDQGLCTGAGYVLESVNDSLRVYTTAGRPLTQASVPLAQFFGRQPSGTLATDFISDPRCVFDPQTHRWFVTILDLSEPVTGEFVDDLNLLAVSKTPDPTKGWYIYSFDVTDDGLNGSPAHAGCLPGPDSVVPGCLGDQPTIGIDAYGVYVTDNEYAFSEVFPVAPPVYPPFQQLPVLRSGVAQLYALSKRQLIHGTDSTLVRVDTGSIPFPGPAEDSPWQSISPAKPVAGDGTAEPASGVEYFVSDIGLPVAHDANQMAVWAWEHTATLDGTPNLQLEHTVVTTPDSFYAPDPSVGPFPAYQEDGPHPTADGAGDPEEYLNANDSRVSWVALAGGRLWTAVNTQLAPSSPGASGHAGEPRVGFLWVEIVPSLTGGHLTARTARDGYVQVADGNVLFPSIAARPDGVAVATFTLAGINYFPSVAWARLDAGRPVVHVALRGAAPEDGFSGLGTLGQQGLFDVIPCGPCVARWGDYTESQVDEHGCIWGAAEYIPTGKHDKFAETDWGTGIYHVCPPPAR